MGITDRILQRLEVPSGIKDLTKNVKKTGFPTTFLNPNYPAGNFHQMDLLFLPEDKSKKQTYKYLLVVTDIGSGKVDAKPLKSKEGKEVLENAKRIYNSGKYLKQPKYIHIDAGNEFSPLRKYFLSEKVGVRVASVGRHSQQSVVEAINKIIGSTIMKLQLNDELHTGDVSTEWVDFLPDILEIINEERAKEKNKKTNEKQTILCEKTECDLYEIGQEMRVALDYPKNIRNERQYGSFRSGDIRWSLKPHKIENILLLPNQPIRYVMEGISTNTFSKYQIKPYNKIEVKKLAGKDIPEKIVEIFKLMGSRGAKPVDKLSFRIKFQGKELEKNKPYPASEYRTRKQLNDVGIDDKTILELIKKGGNPEFPTGSFPPLFVGK